MKQMIALTALLACAGCAAPFSPTPFATEQTLRLEQAGRFGSFTATPMRVVEDSRCPVGVECVWAGRVIVATAIETAGSGDTRAIRIEEGSSHDVAPGVRLTLSEVLPERTPDGEIAPSDYRFTYAVSEAP